jgi:hypothetical protein
MIKICRTCFQAKIENVDFYACSGKSRSECKRCTIARNGVYQKALESWKTRYVDEDARRAYMRLYYNKNKEKFAEYREAFKARHPGYYREYSRARKEKGQDVTPTLHNNAHTMNDIRMPQQGRAYDV